MQRAFLLAGTIAAVFSAAAAALGVPSRVHACSAGPDFNPVTQSNVIVGGWITSWSDRTKPPGEAPLGSYLDVVLSMDVDLVWKGSPGPVMQFVDGGSLLPAGTQPTRWQGGASCGAFTTDPLGRYVVLGLYLDESGQLRSNNLMNFYQGDVAPDARALGAIQERLAYWGLTRLPVTGHGPAGPAGGDGGLVVMASTALSFAGLIAIARRGNNRHERTG